VSAAAPERSGGCGREVGDAGEVLPRVKPNNKRKVHTILMPMKRVLATQVKPGLKVEEVSFETDVWKFLKIHLHLFTWGFKKGSILDHVCSAESRV